MASIPNRCVCRFCVDCGAHFVGEACTCGSEGVPQFACCGCTDDLCELVGILAAQWFEANPTTGGEWRVSGRGISICEEAPVPFTFGGGDMWEQVWEIEPWPGGVMLASIFHDGVPVDEPMMVSA